MLGRLVCDGPKHYTPKRYLVQEAGDERDDILPMEECKRGQVRPRPLGVMTADGADSLYL